MNCGAVDVDMSSAAYRPRPFPLPRTIRTGPRGGALPTGRVQPIVHKMERRIRPSSNGLAVATGMPSLIVKLRVMSGKMLVASRAVCAAIALFVRSSSWSWSGMLTVPRRW